MRSLIPIALLCGAAACGTPEPATPEAARLAPELAARELAPLALPDTKNVHVLDGVVLAGQPSQAGLEALGALGVKSVLNSRKEAEMAKVAFDEQAVVEGLGMAYQALPWNGPDELTDDVLDATRAFLNDAPRPALYHCASANRVGAGWAAWRALDRGLDVEAAIAEGKAVGMRTPEYEPKVRDYIARRRARD